MNDYQEWAILEKRLNQKILDRLKHHDLDLEDVLCILDQLYCEEVFKDE